MLVRLFIKAASIYILLCRGILWVMTWSPQLWHLGGERHSHQVLSPNLQHWKQLGLQVAS